MIIFSLFQIIWKFFDTRMEPMPKPWIFIWDKAPFVRKGVITNGALSRINGSGVEVIIMFIFIPFRQIKSYFLIITLESST